MRLYLALLAVFLAQPPQTRSTFEVATIKRNTSGSDTARFSGQTGRVVITNNPLRNIISNA